MIASSPQFWHLLHCLLQLCSLKLFKDLPGTPRPNSKFWNRWNDIICVSFSNPGALFAVLFLAIWFFATNLPNLHSWHPHGWRFRLIPPIVDLASTMVPTWKDSPASSQTEHSSFKQGIRTSKSYYIIVCATVHNNEHDHEYGVLRIILVECSAMVSNYSLSFSKRSSSDTNTIINHNRTVPGSQYGVYHCWYSTQYRQ